MRIFTMNIWTFTVPYTDRMVMCGEVDHSISFEVSYDAFSYMIEVYHERIWG